MNASIITESILDTLFPTSCILCGKGKEWICNECFSRVAILETQFCPVCENQASPEGKICCRCRKAAREIPFSSAVFATEYDQVSRMVHLLKYRFVREMAEPFGRMMAKAFILSGAGLPDAIVPVPIHPAKLRARGFNQSNLLARSFAREIAPGLEIPILEDSVARIRKTPPQMRIGSYHDRIENVRGAFRASDAAKRQLKGKRLLVIDDIVTTGTTVSECAKALLAAEPKEISVLAVARQRLK